MSDGHVQSRPPAPASRDGADTASPARVLLLDPEDAAGATLDAILTAAGGWAVTRAATLAAARDALAAATPDLVCAAPRLADGPATALLGEGPAPSWPLVLLIRAPDQYPAALAGLAAGAFDCVTADALALPDLPRRARQLIEQWRRRQEVAAAETALRDKEAFNFALFQHNPAAMVVVDRSSRVIKSNLARRALAESLPELGAPLYRTDSDELEATLAAALESCIQRETVHHFDAIAWGGRWLNLTMAPFPGGAVVILDDITARKQAEDEARRTQEQLIQADKLVALGTLVSGVAHEVSNPNNAMLLSTAALKRLGDDLIAVLDRVRDAEGGDFDVGMRTYSEVRDELPELVGVIGRAAQRIKNLVDDLKTYARKGPDTLTETVDLNAVLAAAASLMQPLIRKSTRNFSMDRAPNLPTVAGNAQQLEQVIINLLSNACQALGNPEQRITASTRLDDAAGMVVVDVQDTGAGIAPEHLARITDPFFTTKQDSGGTGLGLSISRTIVERHHGELRFTSAPGRGTQAAMRIPVRGTARGRNAPESGGTPP